MKRRVILGVIAANLLVLLALIFVYPHLMVSPGPLIPAHAALTTDCFACHAAFRGAAPERCTSCHAIADIGLRTTKGIALPQSGMKTSFHQELIEQDCMACHSEHPRPRLTAHPRKEFSHELLRPAARARCNVCHLAPDNDFHRDLDANCSQCHKPDHWKPATFDHERLFLLDGDHKTACVTCHVGNDFSRFTCYGCHEHTPQKVRAEHLEEGIRDFENCVECHRNARDEPEHGKSGRRRERD